MLNTFLVFSDLPEQMLQRKIDLCRNILRVYDAIDPGGANQRTNVLFELNYATIVQTKIKFQSKFIERDEAIVLIIFETCERNNPKPLFQMSINENLKTIKTCYDILIMETENKGIMDNRLEKILGESFI